MDKYFVVSAKATACADKKLNNNTVKNLYRSFCLGDGELTLTEGKENTFVLGTAEIPTLPEGKEWALRIDEKGAAVVGRDFGGLMRGYMVLLMKMEYTDDAIRMAFCEDVSAYRFENRTIHICIFPDSGDYFIKKLIHFFASEGAVKFKRRHINIQLFAKSTVKYQAVVCNKGVCACVMYYF